MRNQILHRGLYSIVLLVFAFSLWAQEIKTEFFQGHEVVAQEVLVKFQPEAQKTVAQVMAEFAFSLDLDNVEGVGGAGWILLHSRSKDVETLVRELSARADVAYVEPNFVVQIHDVLPDDPRFAELWSLRNTGQVIRDSAGTLGADIGAARAWEITTGSSDNVVAVQDTGIQYNHPDLRVNIWSAPTDFAVTMSDGQVINCPAGSHGFNAINNTCVPFDDNGHGTHVAGTIGAVGDNALGVAGVNWTASIMGLKFLGADSRGTIGNAIKTIRFAVQTKAYFESGGSADVRVINASWGCSGLRPDCYSRPLLAEIFLANDADILFVASAGNDGSDNDRIPAYPASYNAPNVIAVAATDNRDRLATFPPPLCAPPGTNYRSNFGRRSVHLGAPGKHILSTVWTGDYDYMCGTSMAAPHVSGAAALILSACSLDTARLKSFLLRNVDRIGIPTITGGRLNVDRAIRNCFFPRAYVTTCYWGCSI